MSGILFRTSTMCVIIVAWLPLFQERVGRNNCSNCLLTEEEEEEQITSENKFVHRTVRVQLLNKLYADINVNKGRVSTPN